jgi:hypothetical protein
MKESEHNSKSDVACVLEYLRRQPNDFVSHVEISQQADSEVRFLTNQNWAQTALTRLVELRLAETDGSRNYRLKMTRADAGKGSGKRFISPQIKVLLRQNGQNIDPTRCASPRFFEPMMHVAR